MENGPAVFDLEEQGKPLLFVHFEKYFSIGLGAGSLFLFGNSRATTKEQGLELGCSRTGFGG